MKIAIATENGRVSEHFGHCPAYTLYSVENDVIFRREDLPNPGHQPGILPPYLASHNVTHIIAGGMGPRAVQLFQEYGIQVILGVSGPVDRVAQEFIAGRIIPGISSCHHPDGDSCSHGHV
jgi:predicted Fe-Mo cluster-binding NifX family protein